MYNPICTAARLRSGKSVASKIQIKEAELEEGSIGEAPGIIIIPSPTSNPTIHLSISVFCNCYLLVSSCPSLPCPVLSVLSSSRACLVSVVYLINPPWSPYKPTLFPVRSGSEPVPPSIEIPASKNAAYCSTQTRTHTHRTYVHTDPKPNPIHRRQGHTTQQQQQWRAPHIRCSISLSCSSSSHVHYHVPR